MNPLTLNMVAKDSFVHLCGKLPRKKTSGSRDSRGRDSNWSLAKKNWQPRTSTRVDEITNCCPTRRSALVRKKIVISFFEIQFFCCCCSCMVRCSVTDTRDKVFFINGHFFVAFSPIWIISHPTNLSFLRMSQTFVPRWRRSDDFK